MMTDNTHEQAMIEESIPRFAPLTGRLTFLRALAAVNLSGGSGVFR